MATINVTDSSAVSSTVAIDQADDFNPAPAETTAVADTISIGIPSFLQNAPTSIAQITTRDVVRYGGNQAGAIAISSVGTVATSPGNIATVTVTLVDGSVLAMSTANTVLKSFNIDSNGISVAHWVFSQ